MFNWRVIHHFGSSILLLVTAILIGGCTGTPMGPGNPTDFPTRDIGSVTAVCKQITFIVSLNDDDDNANRRADLRERANPATEDNVREFIFTHPTADAVFISDVLIVANNLSAVGSRVRGYQVDRRSNFVFNTMHPTSAAIPLKMYLEGIKTSGQVNDIGFEYQYFKNKKPLCGGGAQGTVVDVNGAFTVPRGRGTNFSRHRKMLISATGQASANLTPANAGQHEWTYDIAANVNLPTAAQLTTNVVAQANVTATNHLEQDQLRFKVKNAGQTIEAHFPINLTSPQHTSITRGTRRGFNFETAWLDANRGNFTLVPTRRIRYRMLDQFQASIHDSAYGARMPQIRENIGTVLTSPVPTVQAWILSPPPAGLSWTNNWINKPAGNFTDRIQALNVNKNLVVVTLPGGRRMFHNILQAVGGVLMQVAPPATHIWQMSVNGVGIVDGTRNTFSSTVSRTRPRGGGTQIRIRSIYQANPQ